MNTTKKDLIIKAFQEMDVSMLEVVLDDSKTYKGTTKQIFIEKIEAVFAEFKRNDDDKLLPYKGFCRSDSCKHKGKSGYSFVGNNSRNCIDLIFEETEDDIDDIYNCSDFVTIENIVRFRIGASSFNSFIRNSFLNIFEDEKVGFNPSVDLLINLQNCKLAIKELIQNQDEIIGYEIYSEWLSRRKHKRLLLHKWKHSYSAIEEFESLYFGLNCYEKYYRLYREIAKEAVEEYERIDLTNEKELLRWLVKYEEIDENPDYRRLGFVTPSYVVSKNDKYIEFAGGVRINALDFKYIVRFGYLFNSNRYEMLEKYSCSDEDLFIKEYVLVAKEEHIRNSKQRYQHYLQVRDSTGIIICYIPELNSEEEFVEYLVNCISDKYFIERYLRYYFEDEYNTFLKKMEEEKIDTKYYPSLSYHLRKGGIEL
ncbi:MAG: hypothetical protein LC109_04475 [Bacteroidia bacterium]|nr:hypothetical protein [Bacteroidia bacterium]